MSKAVKWKAKGAKETLRVQASYWLYCVVPLQYSPPEAYRLNVITDAYSDTVL